MHIISNKFYKFLTNDNTKRKISSSINIKYENRPSLLNGYGGTSSHDVKAEDLSSTEAPDVKPNIYALKSEMQASDYSNKEVITNLRRGLRPAMDKLNNMLNLTTAALKKTAFSDYVNANKDGNRSGETSPYEDYPRADDRYPRTSHNSHSAPHPAHIRDEAENLSLNEQRSDK